MNKRRNNPYKHDVIFRRKIRNAAGWSQEIPFVIGKLILRKLLKFHRRKIKRAKTFITRSEWHDDIANLPVFINKQRIKIPSENSILQTNCFSSPSMPRTKPYEIGDHFVLTKVTSAMEPVFQRKFLFPPILAFNRYYAHVPVLFLFSLPLLEARSINTIPEEFLIKTSIIIENGQI